MRATSETLPPASLSRAGVWCRTTTTSHSATSPPQPIGSNGESAVELSGRRARRQRAFTAFGAAELAGLQLPEHRLRLLAKDFANALVSFQVPDDVLLQSLALCGAKPREFFFRKSRGAKCTHGSSPWNGQDDDRKTRD